MSDPKNPKIIVEDHSEGVPDEDGAPPTDAPSREFEPDLEACEQRADALAHLSHQLADQMLRHDDAWNAYLRTLTTALPMLRRGEITAFRFMMIPYDLVLEQATASLAVHLRQLSTLDDAVHDPCLGAMYRELAMLGSIAAKEQVASGIWRARKAKAEAEQGESEVDAALAALFQDDPTDLP